MSSRAGFSLLELLVATLLFSGVAAALFTLLGSAQEGADAQTEMADVQQRLRVAVTALTGALHDAGGGALVGATRGPLVQWFPPVVPTGDTQITLLALPFTGAQALLAAPAAPGAVALTIALAPGCAPATAASVCGFRAGTPVLLADGQGRRDIVTVTAIAGTALTITHPGALATTYPVGTLVSEVAMDRYYREEGPDGGQLVHDDGAPPGFPVVDHLAGLSFEYFGDPQPPRLVVDPPGAPPGLPPGPPRTTYGPPPPPLLVDDAADPWPAGENCLFSVMDGAQVSRLPALAAGPALIPLAAAAFDDGPWCPDDASAVRFDADLLRIRRVRVRLRVEAGDAFRGAAGALFSRPGTTRRAGRFVPDQAITIDVTPPNLAVPR